LVALEEEAQRINAKVIVIDPLRRVSTIDENSSQDVAELGRRLVFLSNKNSRLVIGIHHLSKNGAVRGSTDHLAMVDSSVRLTRTGDVVRLEAEHHGHESFSIKFRARSEDDALIAELLDAPSSSAVLAERILAALRGSSEGPLNTRRLREVLRDAKVRAENGEITKALSELEKDGQVENVSTSKKERKWQAR
jgi:hypothetical protein